MTVDVPVNGLGTWNPNVSFYLPRVNLRLHSCYFNASDKCVRPKDEEIICFLQRRDALLYVYVHMHWYSAFLMYALKDELF